MSNIIFNMQVREDLENPREINHNIALEKKLNTLKKQQEKDLRDKLRMEGQDGEPLLDEEGNPINFDEMDDYGGEDEVPADFVSEEKLKEMEEEAQRRADDIIANAKSEADLILEDAKREADAAMSNAMQKGQEEGYQKGLIQAQNELNVKKAQMDEELQARLDEFNQARESMEKDLIDVITEVVDKVFKCQFSGKKDMIFNLVTETLNYTDGSKNILIRVGPDNYDALMEKVQDLKNMAGEDVNLSVAQDALLGPEKCMIETDGGILDCSMDVEMENLIRDIKSLL